MRFPVILFAILSPILLCAQVIPYNTIPDWISAPNGHIATGLGLADINDDGFKDLVVANGNDIERQHLVVYYNQGDGTFPLNPDWESADIDYHGHLACGDLDNDGDIDVAVSVYIGPSGFSSPGKLKVYYNLNGQLQTTPAFISDPFYTFSCALGDADADGDLDIAAVAGEPYGGLLDYGKIFLNNNGSFQPVAEWNSSILMGSLDVEFGDFNLDGFLDLIFVCEGTPNVIYLANEEGIIDEDPDWQSEEPQNYINSVDIGYLSDQSIVVMTENDQLGGDGKVRKYDFNSTIPASSLAGWYSNPFGYGSGIILNDVDIDGTLDLVYGGWWLPVKIALGDGTGFEMNTSYTSSTSSVVEAILMADLDRVDIEVREKNFPITSAQENKNVLILDRPLVEKISFVQRNGNWLQPEYYKHVPGKPWVIFSEPFQPGDEILVSFQYSDYPDMVVTNWDSNKGNYIFYNTESSVGLDEHGGMDTRKPGDLDVWPVPARQDVRFTFNGRMTTGNQGSPIIEIYNASGSLVKSMYWPEGKDEINVDLQSMLPGIYTVILKVEDNLIPADKFVISR